MNSLKVNLYDLNVECLNLKSNQYASTTIGQYSCVELRLSYQHLKLHD